MEQVNALEILREAMHLEKEGMRFYTKAAKCASNPRARQVFKRLAQDELGHLEKLELVYDNLVETSEWLVMQDLADSSKGGQADVDVFEQGLGDEGLDEFGAIETGIRAEKESIEFYKRSRDECGGGDHRGKELFNWLISFEKQHLSLLQDLKKEYADS